MPEDKKRPKYERPVARDLSGFSVEGDDEAAKGTCFEGTALTFDVCRDGTLPAGGTCAPCGLGPTQGYCDFGSGATEGCLSGSGHF